MGKHSKGIKNYQEVRESVSDARGYGNMAHEKSCEQFHRETGRKATIDDAYTLVTMAKSRQDHWHSGSNVDTHIDDI
jgi:hypothetical protein